MEMTAATPSRPMVPLRTRVSPLVGPVSPFFLENKAMIPPTRDKTTPSRKTRPTMNSIGLNTWNNPNEGQAKCLRYTLTMFDDHADSEHIRHLTNAGGVTGSELCCLLSCPGDRVNRGHLDDAFFGESVTVV